MKKITCFLLFLCAGYSASSQEQPPLVTRMLLEANQTAAGYVISGTMFYEIVAELQAVQERLKAKDRDIEILMEQKKELENVITLERQAKDMLVQERVADVLFKEGLVLEHALSPEEKADVENVIKKVITGKTAPIPIIKEPVKEEPILEVKQ